MIGRCNFTTSTFIGIQSFTSMKSVCRKEFYCVSAGPYNTLITQHPDCKALLAAHPNTQGALNWVDGNTSGYRVLHSIFAETNPHHHCPHIAFERTLGTVTVYVSILVLYSLVKRNSCTVLTFPLSTFFF